MSKNDNIYLGFPKKCFNVVPNSKTYKQMCVVTYILIWIVSCIVFPLKQITNIMSANREPDYGDDKHADVIDEQFSQVIFLHNSLV